MKAHRVHSHAKKCQKQAWKYIKAKKNERNQKENISNSLHMMGMSLNHFGNFNPSISLIGLMIRFEMQNQVKG